MDAQFIKGISAKVRWLDDANVLQILEKDELLKNFKLSLADSNVSFEDVESEMYRVDLEKVGDQDYTPKPFKMNTASRQRFNSVALASSRDNQLRNVTAHITQLIGNMYPITDPEIKQYVEKIVNGMDVEQLQDCLERDAVFFKIVVAFNFNLSDSFCGLGRFGFCCGCFIWV